MNIKELIKKICAASALVSVTLGALSCSSARQGKPTAEQQHDWWLNSDIITPKSARKLWSKKLDGYIIELAVAQQGNAVLVATLPDYDHEGGAKKNLLRYYNGSGREMWKQVLPTQAKSQAISDDGSLAIATTHEDQIIAFSAKGKQLWTAHATCMPFMIESRREIVCYHDDDAEPEVAFDVFDWNGKLKRSYPIKNDILTLKVSRDESHIAFALTQGQVIVLGPDYQVQWSGKVPGEVVDLDISNGADPTVAALYSQGFGKSVKLSVLKSGKQIAEGEPLGRVNQIGLTPDGESIFTYGNAESGQYISYWSGAPLHEVWRKTVTRNAHYSPTLFVSAPAQAIIGFEQVNASTRQSKMIGLDRAGNVLWNLPVSQALDASEGAYLYAQSWVPTASKLGIATDDRSFGVFQIKRSEP